MLIDMSVYSDELSKLRKELKKLNDKYFSCVDCECVRKTILRMLFASLSRFQT